MELIKDIKEGIKDAKESFYAIRLNSIKDDLYEIKADLRKLQDNMNIHWSSEELQYINNFIDDTVTEIGEVAQIIGTIAKDIVK